MQRNIILIPVYNDWRSLNLLLKKINFVLNKNNLSTNVIIINDNSSSKNNLIKNKLSRIKKITFLNLKMNVGSQKAISLGLDYINRKEKKFSLYGLSWMGNFYGSLVLKQFFYRFFSAREENQRQSRGGPPLGWWW